MHTSEPCGAENPTHHERSDLCRVNSIDLSIRHVLNARLCLKKTKFIIFSLYALYFALHLFIHIRRNIRHILGAHAYTQKEKNWWVVENNARFIVGEKKRINSNLFNAPLDEIKTWVVFNVSPLIFMSIAEKSIYRKRFWEISKAREKASYTPGRLNIENRRSYASVSQRTIVE